jgi:hypothetical protein
MKLNICNCCHAIGQRRKAEENKKRHIKFTIKISLNKSVVMLTSQENTDTQNTKCDSKSQNKAYSCPY